MRIDVEGRLIAYLNRLCLDAYGDVPASATQDAPKRFLTVERTGGAMDEDGIADRAAVVVQAWAEDRASALQLAIAADSVMPDFEREPGIRLVVPAELVNFPPMDGSGRGRYQLSYTIVTQSDEAEEM